MPDVLLAALTYAAPLYASLLVLGAFALAGKLPAPTTKENR